MSIFPFISRRISVRNFQPEQAPLDVLEAVRKAGEHADALTSTEMRFYLRTAQEMGREVKGIFGDYGKTIHAPHFIVLTSRVGEGYLTDAGYRFEQMVLEATRRGLGTCWVGLMFKEATLRAALGLDDSWRVIVLSPIGYPLEKSMMNNLMRTLAGSKGRLPIDKLFFWQRHGQPLPPEITSNQKLMQIFDATRWAPSWRNEQPWRFVLRDREILVYKLRKQDREGKDYNRLDCGIAMCHLHFASKELGITGQWELGTFDVPGAPDAEVIGKYRMEALIG